MQPLQSERDYCERSDAIAPPPTTLEFLPLDQPRSDLMPIAPVGLDDPVLELELEQPSSHAASSTPDATLQWVLSRLLQAGVMVASVIVFTGGILYLVRHGSEPVDYRVFHSEPEFLRHPRSVIEGAIAGRRLALIQLGVLILMATPVLRVVVSWATFLWHRDRLYGVLTSLVLTGLIYSLLGIYR